MHVIVIMMCSLICRAWQEHYHWHWVSVILWCSTVSGMHQSSNHLEPQIYFLTQVTYIIEGPILPSSLVYVWLLSKTFYDRSRYQNGVYFVGTWSYSVANICIMIQKKKLSHHLQEHHSSYSFYTAKEKNVIIDMKTDAFSVTPEMAV